MRTLELLAPAKNLACGMAAVDHGADAVYIGAPKFGARAGAVNSLDDIRQLCQYAHPFGVRVYVTVNTLVYEEELRYVRELITNLHDMGVDALLIQDMGIVEMMRQGFMPSMPLHASTQMDNRTADKVEWLRSVGFRRVVLARELSAQEIADIHAQVPDVELEVFVHGALCVSYSGICYASQYCFNRSANRGECAQFCRLKFDLVDKDGHEIVHQQHLLSLKDMCQIDRLEDLVESGACSFKIEGRLKDVDYVKNVVSAYSQRLNQIVSRHPDKYQRASRGQVDYNFTPNLQKTFNRGYTHYFLEGRKPDIASFATPKAMGEYVGEVKEIYGNSFTVAGLSSFQNGDGLCFINTSKELEGFRVNRVENNRLFPFKMPRGLYKGLKLYRNHDVAFEKILGSDKTAVRLMPIVFSLMPDTDGFLLRGEVEGTDIQAETRISISHQKAQKPQNANIIRQLSKLGGTCFVCRTVNMLDDVGAYFIPSSMLADMRRDVVARLSRLLSGTLASLPMNNEAEAKPVKEWQSEYARYSYLYNIANSYARTFYAKHGMEHPVDAFEIHPVPEPVIMQCRHCLRYALGYCVKHGGRRPTWHEPLRLRLADGRLFRLEFRCEECQMNVIAESQNNKSI